MVLIACKGIVIVMRWFVHGVFMLYRLFEISPHLQDLFSFKGQELTDENEGLRKHALDVMKTVDFAINSLDDIPALQDTLVELGMTHSFKSVKTTHFAVSD